MLQEAIQKARALHEAMTYIQKYRGKTVVIKFGGSVMDDPAAIDSILADVVFMATVGIHPVLIHGGGKAISHAMEERGLEVTFIQGRRYTDQRTLTVVEHVLCNEINKSIVETLQAKGATAMGLHTLGSCVLFGEKLFLEEDGRKIDLGEVGRVKQVNADLLAKLTQTGCVPVLTPLALNLAGGKLNCNADTAAGNVAADLKAEKLVVVSDTHGIRADVTDPDSYIPVMTETDIRHRIDDGTISAGMLPKVEACLHALDAGVKRTHIIDGKITHSLLLEIFSDKGIGTLIKHDDE